MTSANARLAASIPLPPNGIAAVRVPATTANLGPGFDAFGAAITLHLEAVAEPRNERRERIVSEGEGAGELPSDDRNLVWRSFIALCEEAGVPAPDVAVSIRNAVPLERGLGSSSAAIVAGLALARAVCRLPVGDLDLVRLAADIEGHPDNVAPAVLGGLVCAGRSDRGELIVRRAQPHARLVPVVFVPVQRQATTDARAVLPDTLGRDHVGDQAARAGHVLAALLGVWPVAPDLAGDRLHEPPRLAAMAPTRALVAELRAAGIHAWLSGAGPSACAAIPQRDAAARQRCARIGGGKGFSVRVLRWDLSGLLTTPANRP
ncbi:MAG: homoserine kinase [Actinomycetota bacterium]|nr:homoserine kinase [Actinomycetota bacterium]